MIGDGDESRRDGDGDGNKQDYDDDSTQRFTKVCIDVSTFDPSSFMYVHDRYMRYKQFS